MLLEFLIDLYYNTAAWMSSQHFKERSCVANFPRIPLNYCIVIGSIIDYCYAWYYGSLTRMYRPPSSQTAQSSPLFRSLPITEMVDTRWSNNS
jgi:hypothetical protein